MDEISEQLQKMNIAIVGAGLTGCTLGYLLSKRKHNITIFEKERWIGGMCKTMYLKGLKYEHSGHIFHTNKKEIVDFIKQFCEIRSFKHYVGSKVRDEIYPFPICKRTIDLHPKKEKILGELRKLPEEPRTDDFEVAIISMVGKTLYKDFVKNYTEKMWGMSPKELPAEMAFKRISPNDKDESYFKDKYQFYPLPDYNFLLSQMVKGCTVFTNEEYKKVFDDYFDLIIFTNSIDEVIEKKEKLEYRSIEIIPEIVNQKYFHKNYGTVNYPNDEDLLRITEYKKINGQESDNTLITKEYPSDKYKQYPVNTEKNEELFNKYLKEICKSKNKFVFGRLGLYKYFNMGECIEMCINNIDFIENYLKMKPQEKYEKYCELRR